MPSQQFASQGCQTRPAGRTKTRLMITLGVSALLAAAGLTATVTTAPTAGAATASVKVMPLGDSLTGGPGCWRALLWSSLQASGHTGVDFVGTLPGGGCNLANWDGDNEGHGGYLAITTAQQSYLPGWLSATSPDLVMMTFGTNDIWNNRPTADIIAAFSTLVDQMRQHKPSMRILVAQIPPVAAPGCAYCLQGTIDLNNAIPGWAAAKTTTQSPITVVDQWTGWDPAVDTTDGVHQTESGNQKMASIWYKALTSSIGTVPTSQQAVSPSTTPASPSSSASASPSASGSPAASGSASASASPGSPSPSSPTTTACSAKYSVVNTWSGGFQGEVSVTAGQDGVSRWTVTWQFGSGQTITQVWNATLSTSDTTVTATPVAWNAALAPLASTSFGFLGTYSGTGSSPVPAVTCAAG